MGTKEKDNRFLELEGLRGIAAVMVAVYHFLLAFYVLAFFGPGGAQHMRLEDNLYGTPIMAVLSGTLAVAIFFVLSGFVLSIGFFYGKGDRSIKDLAVRRYLRLMLPALASTLLAALAIGMGLSGTQQVANITQSTWLMNNWNFIPSIFDALYSGMLQIFTTTGSAYNNVLWTMQTEFLGSFVVFGFLMLFGKSNYRWIFYLGILAVTFNTWFLGFVLGMILADLYANQKIFLGLFRKSSLVTLGVLAMIFGGFPMGELEGTIYSKFVFADSVNWRMLYLTLAATIIVLLILTSTKLTQLLRHRKVSFLGKYTFSLYLVHLIVIYSYSMLVFRLVYSMGLAYNLSVLVTLVASVPIVIGLTWLFEKYVDSNSIKTARLFNKFINNEISALHVYLVMRRGVLEMFAPVKNLASSMRVSRRFESQPEAE